jgi:hypothetical protein
VVWSWCHASYGANFCLRWTAEQLACAFMYGAAIDLDVEVCTIKFDVSLVMLYVMQISSPADQPWWRICVPNQPIDEDMIRSLSIGNQYYLRF